MDPEPAVGSGPPPPSPSKEEPTLQSDSQPVTEEKELPQIFGEQTQTAVGDQVKEDKPSPEEAEGDQTRVDGEKLLPTELEVPADEKTNDDTQTNDMEGQENEVGADKPVKQAETEPLQTDKPQESDNAEDATNKAGEEQSVSGSQPVDNVETTPTIEDTNAESVDQLPAGNEQS